MNTSNVLAAMIKLLRVYQGGTRGQLLMASGELELMQKEWPIWYEKAIKAIERTAAQESVIEHIQADEERT